MCIFLYESICPWFYVESIRLAMMRFTVGKYPKSFFKPDLFKKVWREGAGVIRRAQVDMLSVTNIDVCNRRLFSFPSKVEMAEEQEYFCCLSVLWSYRGTFFQRGGGVLLICS